MNLNPTATNCILFVIITYALTCIMVWGLPSQHGTSLAMFVPAVVAISLTIYSKQNVRDLFKRSSLKNCLLGFVVAIMAELIYYGLSLAYYGFSFFQGRSMLEEIKDLNIEGTLIFLLIIFVVSIAISLSKEIGWRGYLLKNLKSQIPNFYMRAIVVGLVWAIWFIPIYKAMGSLLWKDGLTFPIVCAHILSTCTVSVMFTWLFEKDNSIWPVTIAYSTWIFVYMFDEALFGEHLPVSTSDAVIGDILLAVAYFVVAMGVIWFEKCRKCRLSSS